MKLLSYSTDAKTKKGEPRGYLTFVMYLAPSKESVPHGGRDVCPWASPGCAHACLYTAGRGAFASVQAARLRKTVQFFTDRKQFMADLYEDIVAAEKIAKLRGMVPVFRLNGTSDLNWDKVVADHPHLQFYDYTKSLDRVVGNVFTNYHLTFSRSETNEADALQVLFTGGNVAVVFATSSLPATWKGYRVISGDADDLRFLDPANVVVGLKAKGKARKDSSGFVVKT